MVCSFTVISMSESNPTVVVSLLSGLIGAGAALASAYLTNRISLKRDEREAQQRKSQLLRERGEELYSSSVTWLNNLFGHYMRRNAVMQGKLTYNQCLDLDIAEGEKQPKDFHRIELIIDVYFPSTRRSYDLVIAERARLNKVERGFKRAYESGQSDGSLYLGPYVETQKKLEEAGEAIKAEILNCVRDISA